MKYIKDNNNGQSLLELLIAITVLVTALVATVVLIINSIEAGKASRNKLIGTNFAREGIEIVRNIRDSNWIDPNGVNWDDSLIGVADSTAIPIIDGSSDITLNFSVDAFTDGDAQIKVNSSQYVQGLSLTDEDTSFFRLLYINPICQDNSDPVNEKIADKENTDSCGEGEHTDYDNKVGIRIISEVRWPVPDSKRKVVIEDRLYNWQAL